MAEQDWLGKDFYAVLGVSKDADDKEISKAFRKLARKYHPDSHPGDAAAEEKFKEISEAYEVLSNKSERQKYDAIRSFGAGGARFAGGSGAGGYEDIFGSMFSGMGGARGGYSQMNFGGINLEDLMAQASGAGAYGGGNPFSQPRRSGFSQNPYEPQPAPVKGEDRKTSVTLSFDKAVHGATVSLSINGESFKTKVPAGIHDGQKIRVHGKGKPGQHGGTYGDLYLTVQVKKDPVFSMDGADLIRAVPVTVAEAALGGKITVLDYEGEEVQVKIPAGSTTGTQIRVKKHGVKTKKVTGDLVVRLEVQVPATLSREQKKALKAFEEASADFSEQIVQKRSA
ncbi:DnaJ C-terminal domain-containing protein [Alloscardovia omnicolens]|uniref:DnaJ C-terminal domain-containing protein n=1 Tax=Alloscardovia omnicolens TaxID=419015 RepID=UPI003A778A31